MARVGDKVKFVGAMAHTHEGCYTIAEIDLHTGGIRLEGMSGQTFDPRDLVHAATEKSVEEDRSASQPTVSHSFEPEPYVTAQILDLVEALPEAQLIPPETGFREMSFYRFPVVGECFCRKPYRLTLDGVRCEDNHYRET